MHGLIFCAPGTVRGKGVQMRSLRDTIAALNEAAAAGRVDGFGGVRTVEADSTDRGSIVVGPVLPARLVGRFRVTPLSPWIRWTSHDDAAFPSLCAAFDRMTAGKAVSR